MRKMSNKTILTTAIAAVISLSLLLGGCGTDNAVVNSSSNMGGMSRVKLYDSEKSLADDSVAIVIGRVTDQSVERGILDDSTDFTINDISIFSKIKGGDEVDPGNVIKVRQTGSEEQVSGDKLLDDGVTYLLYLSPSGLDGALSQQYYITGATAGVYQADESSSNTVNMQNDNGNGFIFKRVNADSGDNLPETINRNQLEGSQKQ